MKPNKLFELRLTETINRIINEIVHPMFQKWDCQSPVVIGYRIDSWLEKVALEQVLQDLADNWKVEVKPIIIAQHPGVEITLTALQLEEFPDEAFKYLKDIKP